MSNPLETEVIPIACNPNAIQAEDREEHFTSTQALFALAQDVRELSQGYAFQLPNDADTFMNVMRYVANERQCCPFFNFTLELQAKNGPFWFHVTGAEGVKAFLQNELGIQSNGTALEITRLS